MGEYKNKKDFEKDFRKIFTNARTYNKPHTFFYKASKDLEAYLEEDIKKLPN